MLPRACIPTPRNAWGYQQQTHQQKRLSVCVREKIPGASIARAAQSPTRGGEHEHIHATHGTLGRYPLINVHKDLQENISKVCVETAGYSMNRTTMAVMMTLSRMIVCSCCLLRRSFLRTRVRDTRGHGHGGDAQVLHTGCTRVAQGLHMCCTGVPPKRRAPRTFASAGGTGTRRSRTGR